MTIKLKSTWEYKNAIEHIRRYATGFEATDTSGNSTNFDLRHFGNPYHNPLSKSERARVARYFDVYQRHVGYKGTSFQKIKDPKKLTSAQKAMGMPTRQTWRGVFVPQPSENTPAKMRKYGADWVIEYFEQGMDTIFVPFDRMQFVMRDVEYVRELFSTSPKTYMYNLDMGHGRNRWKAGGNLEQMLRDLSQIIFNYGIDAVSQFVLGVHVYRGGLKRFNELKMEHFATVNMKKVTQSQVKVIIRKERRKLHDYQEYLRLKRKFE